MNFRLRRRNKQCIESIWDDKWEWINIAFNVLIDLSQFSGVEEDPKAIIKVYIKEQGKPYNNHWWEFFFSPPMEG